MGCVQSDTKNIQLNTNVSNKKLNTNVSNKKLNNKNSFDIKSISGSHFVKEHHDKQFIKIVSSRQKNDEGIIYCNPYSDIDIGFFDINNAHLFLKYGKYIKLVTIPHDARIYKINDNLFRADKLSLKSSFIELNDDYLIKMIQSDINKFYLIPNWLNNEHICKIAQKINLSCNIPHHIQFGYYCNDRLRELYWPNDEFVFL